MIEKMKMVYVVSSLSRKKEMLDGLEKLGVLHIAEKKGAVHAVTEKFTELSRLTASLAEYLPDKKEQKNRPAKPLLQGEEFEKFYGEVKDAVERKAALEQELSVLHAEIERVSPWGDITSEDLELLKDRKYDLYFYRVPASTYAALWHRTKRITLPPARQPEATIVSCGCPDMCRKQMWMSSKHPLQRTVGHMRLRAWIPMMRRFRPS